MTGGFTVIEQTDEKYAPAEEPVLVVEVIGTDAFLEIAKYDEDGKKMTLTTIATVCVPLEELVHALQYHELTAARRHLTAAKRQAERLPVEGSDDGA